MFQKTLLLSPCATSLASLLLCHLFNYIPLSQYSVGNIRGCEQEEVTILSDLSSCLRGGGQFDCEAKLLYLVTIAYKPRLRNEQTNQYNSARILFLKKITVTNFHVVTNFHIF